MMMRFVLGLVGLWFALGISWAADPAAYEFSLKKADDSIAASTDGNRTVFTILGSSGIGNGTIAIKQGEWSKEVVLRFQLNKTDGFKDLEQFTLTTARFKVVGSRKQSKALPFYLASADGKFSDKPAGTLDIVIEPGQGALEVKLPANLLSGAKKVDIAWIDFFR